MRLFFGLELEPDTALQVSDWRDRQFSFDGKAVPPANFHITLAFIGELREPGLERLCLAVDHWLEQSRPRGGTITLDQTGFWASPGLYWLGPQTWPDQLATLAVKLQGLATKAGARRDRKRFQPHVTLFRRCIVAPSAPNKAPAFSLTYRHFTLFESRQGKSGVSYLPVCHWELSPPAA